MNDVTSVIYAYFFVLFCIAGLVGLIPASIASGKGRSFFGWWVYGTLLFIFALIHSLLITADEKFLEERKLKEGMKKCPKCAELVRPEATICRYCNSEL